MAATPRLIFEATTPQRLDLLLGTACGPLQLWSLAPAARRHALGLLMPEPKSCWWSFDTAGAPTARPLDALETGCGTDCALFWRVQDRFVEVIRFDASPLLHAFAHDILRRALQWAEIAQEPDVVGAVRASQGWLAGQVSLSQLQTWRRWLRRAYGVMRRENIARGGGTPTSRQLEDELAVFGYGTSPDPRIAPLCARYEARACGGFYAIEGHDEHRRRRLRAHEVRLVHGLRRQAHRRMRCWM